MPKKKKFPEGSGVAFAMCESDAALSFASLFYFQNKMPCELKLQFEEELLGSLSEHAAASVQHETRNRHSYVAMHQRAENYAEKGNKCRMSWILTYAAKLICEEKSGERQNPFKQYFIAYLPYIFADPKQIISFERMRPKLVCIEEDEKRFSFKTLLSAKPEPEVTKEKLRDKVERFLNRNNDPFADAMERYLKNEDACKKGLQDKIDAFVVDSSLILEKCWKQLGLVEPVSKIIQNAPLATAV